MEEELEPGQEPEVREESSEERPAGELASPEEALARKEAELADLKKQILYLRADFENTKKRIEKRYRESAEYAVESLLKDLLPVVDSLEKAVDHAREAGAEGSSAMLEGIELILQQLKAALARHGVEDVSAHGERFDPHLHEAMAHVPGEQENQVGAVYEKGYLLKGRLLRPAKVAVTKVATPRGDG